MMRQCLRKSAYMVFFLLLGGWATSIDGRYEPGCAAYAGDIVTLENGAFSWDRYTDAIRLDENDRPIDPFPGYPISGSYEVDGDRVTFDGGAESAPGPLFIRRTADGTVHLLSAEQIDDWDGTANSDACVLTREIERN